MVKLEIWSVETFPTAVDKVMALTLWNNGRESFRWLLSVGSDELLPCLFILLIVSRPGFRP
ncbi:MAG: hypothetical protein M1608_16760, partial [Candidatus Omnitrophica bacterium]|nr:hypothetical protein [Candidatus Omnitrophota bacterium]